MLNPLVLAALMISLSSINAEYLDTYGSSLKGGYRNNDTGKFSVIPDCPKCFPSLAMIRKTPNLGYYAYNLAQAVSVYGTCYKSKLENGRLPSYLTSRNRLWLANRTLETFEYYSDIRVILDTGMRTKETWVVNLDKLHRQWLNQNGLIRVDHVAGDYFMYRLMVQAQPWLWMPPCNDKQ